MSGLESFSSGMNSEHTQKEKIDFVIAIVVIFLFGTFIFLMSSPFSENILDIPLTENTEELLRTPNDLESDTDLEILSTAKTAKVSHEIVPAATHPAGQSFEKIAFENDSVKKNPTSENIVLTDPVLKDPTIEDPVSLKDSIPTDLTLLVEPQEKIETVTKRIETQETTVNIVDKPSINQRISTPKKSEIVPNLNARVGQEIFAGIEEDCIILVGVFSNTENANRIITDLQKEGYETFRAPYKSLTRTGIKLYCHPQETKEILTIIQTKFNPEAYIVRRKDLNLVK